MFDRETGYPLYEWRADAPKGITRCIRWIRTPAVSPRTPSNERKPSCRRTTGLKKARAAVVQAIAHRTFRGNAAVAERVAVFDDRLAALASCHALLVQADWTGAELAAIVASQLDPYVSENPDRLMTRGPPVVLPPDLATPFGLVLHELATNAAKYGCLSYPAGMLAVTWTLGENDADRIVRVLWTEAGGPAVAKPASVGLGSRLIDGAIPNARVTREFRPEGLVCTIEVPFPELDTAAAE
nr:sensor histidine kinase [Rhodoplanes roseus]